MIVDTLVLQSGSTRQPCAMAHVACGDIPWVLAAHAMEAAGNMVGRRHVEQVLFVAERRAPTWACTEDMPTLLVARSCVDAVVSLRTLYWGGPSRYRVAAALSTGTRSAGTRDYLWAGISVFETSAYSDCNNAALQNGCYVKQETPPQSCPCTVLGMGSTSLIIGFRPWKVRVW